MLAPTAILKEAFRLQKQWYPHAAFFGILFILRLFALIVAEGDPTHISPAKTMLVVTQQMLNSNEPEGDFRLALDQQPLIKAQSRQVTPFAIQGYVDFTSLAWATISAELEDVDPEQMYAMLEEWRQFRHLPLPVQLTTKKFVLAHANWANHHFWPQSLDNIHAFLDLLLVHSEQENWSPAYLSGMQIAHDAALLHLDLVTWWQTQVRDKMDNDLSLRS